MPEFFLELFSEEIPARMQARAASSLDVLCREVLHSLQPVDEKRFFTPRRIACSMTINAQEEIGSRKIEIRGPRENAPEAAVQGFLRKNNTSYNELVLENGYYVFRRTEAPRSAREVIEADLQPALAAFSWPKSMRWGQSADFSWIRPLRRVICLLNDQVVPITLGPVTASNETEGHRFMAPAMFKVTSSADWQEKLYKHYVVVNAAQRRRTIFETLRRAPGRRGLTLVTDHGLLDEVTGLVEWPVPLVGKIDPGFMTLPPEVRELSMRVNQRYFALRDAAGKPAPYFAFAANVEAEDGGATIIAGNERVLRARLADAEHFWNQDRKQPLAEYLPKLKSVIFHAELGTQFERANRIATLSRKIANLLGAEDNVAEQAERAGLLAKADLVTGMVGEFPELQGIMGDYYANDSAVGAAIRTHYQPKGSVDEVPRGLLPCAVALADKIDTLSAFFRIGEKPSGSGDPYALRRSALGVVRIILENSLRLQLYAVLNKANELITDTLVQRSRIDQIDQVEATASGVVITGNSGFHDLNLKEVFSFLIERLRIILKAQDERHDVLDAVFSVGKDDDIISLLEKTKAVSEFLNTEDGSNLLIAYRRAVNILKIEDAKDGPHDGKVDTARFRDDAERTLHNALNVAEQHITYERIHCGYSVLLTDLATLRVPVDAFFEAVKINADNPELRKNRLRLLAKLRDTMHTIADFSKIEG